MPSWSQIIAVKFCLAILIGFLSAVVSSANDGETNQPSAEISTQLVTLSLKLPAPALVESVMCQRKYPSGPDIEPVLDWQKPNFHGPRPSFLVPMGVTNVALFKKAAASVKPFEGTLPLVTDADKEAYDRCVTQFRAGVQWVQVDLGGDYDIYAIALWLDHRYVDTVFQGVVIALADDASFTNNVRVLFNNDRENNAGLGVGQDKRYYESHVGKLLDAKGVRARYVRVYSNGSNLTQLNCFTEVEVWALPAKP